MVKLKKGKSKLTKSYILVLPSNRYLKNDGTNPYIWQILEELSVGLPSVIPNLKKDHTRNYFIRVGIKRYRERTVVLGKVKIGLSLIQKENLSYLGSYDGLFVWK